MLISGRTLGQWSLLGLFAVILYFCFRIMQPFLIPIVLALILSTLLDPLYEKLARKLRERRSIAAIVVCAGLTVAILLPALLLSISLAREANDAYKRVRDPETLNKITSWLDPDTNPILSRVQPWLPSSLRIENIGAQIGSQAQRIGVATLGAATSFAAGLFNFLMDYIIMLVVLFFLLRDSNYFVQRVRDISPLSQRQENLFVERFRRVARATVIGSLLTALAQGTISGLIFLSLGLPNPILWGALTALLSLVPLVGTALIWVPWTIYLFATGSYVSAVIFLITQLLIVGGVDNVLRPALIEGSVGMHTLIVFFSILGGIGYFGILGMFFGPLVFSIAVAFLEFYFATDEGGKPAPL